MALGTKTKRWLLPACLIGIALGGRISAAETRLLRYPDIHQDKIVFSHGGDLYLCGDDGKNVRRLTEFPGEESLAKFSPDGKRIAFTAEFDGNRDVYVMPVQGGKPQRLTFHPADEYVVDWHPDGTRIVFRSNASSHSYRVSRLHTVPVEGGLVEVMELPEAEQAGFDERGERLAFCRTSVATLSWKGYRGGAVPEIWSYDFSRRQAERVVADGTVNHHPLWLGERIYFVSDKGPGKEQNLWMYDTKTKTTRQLTFFTEWPVNRPSKGGQRIVFENGGTLHFFDDRDGKVHPVHVTVPLAGSRQPTTMRDVSAFVSGQPVLSPDGRKVLVSVRGDILLLDTTRKITRNLTNTPGAHERSPQWHPSGRSFAYISDAGGEEQIYVRGEEENAAAVQVSRCPAGKYNMLNWSPDGRKIGFADHRAGYHVLDIETRTIRKVFTNPYQGAEQFASASWSPDSRWLVYAAANANWFHSIHLYSLEQEKSFRVTDEYVHATCPRFDPNGRYLYWVLDGKVNVEDSYMDNDHHIVNPSTIVAATLRRDLPSPFAPGTEAAPAAAPEPFPLRIDIEGLGGRIAVLPIADSQYTELQAAGGKLVYLSTPAKGEPSYRMFDLAARRESVLLQGDAFFLNTAAQADTLVYRGEGGIGILPLKADQRAGEGRLDLSGLQMRLDLRREWAQIFDEAWRIQRDFFFDETLLGVDWAAMKRKYQALLPHVATRLDLNQLLEEMFSELRQSHVEIYGGDMPARAGGNHGLLGIDLATDPASGLYRITKIYRGLNWDTELVSPLTLPGMNVREGDFLLAIDGTPLRQGINPDSLLLDKAGRTVVLTIHGTPTLDGARTVTVIPAAYSERQGDLLRYTDWVLNNIDTVNRASQGKIGYIHIPDTYLPGIASFFRYTYPQLPKQGLILDVRYNSGGYPPGWMIERLNRKWLYQSAMPHGKAAIAEPYPAFFGSMVCLTNEWAESGGDLFAAIFRQWKNGPVIGRRTAGNLASTGARRLIDGGVVIYPAEGEDRRSGAPLIENTGVSPDIEVCNRPEELIQGRDAQLERGVRELLQAIETNRK